MSDSSKMPTNPSDTAATDESLPATIDPATAHYLRLPPALVDAISDQPELLTQLTRSQLAVVQDRMVQRALSDVDISLTALSTVHEQLSKNLRAEKTPAGGGGGNPVIINFVRAGGKDVVTIDGSTGEPVKELS